MRKWTSALTLILAGCATMHPVGREYEVAIYPKFLPSVQALLPLNDLQAIATLDVIPYQETTPDTYQPLSATTGNSTTVDAPDVLKLSQSSPSIDPSRPFILRKLKPNKKYRVYARAYNAANALISEDANSYVGFAVGQDDAPQVQALPVKLINVAFGATAFATINTEGRYDNLKATLFLLSGNAQVAVAQTVRPNPTLKFDNLQGNTTYRLLLEGYKLSTMMASTSQDISIGSETAPATVSVTLRVPYVTSTLAGSGVAGFNDAQGASAQFSSPCWALPDNLGNVYVADWNGNRIRKIASNGMVSTLAGDGTCAVLDGTGTGARFGGPTGLAMDPQGNLYVTDFSMDAIRKVTPAGVVTTLAGSPTGGFLDGTGTAAQFDGPEALASDAMGNIYVGDRYNHRVRKITPAGVVTTVAGNGTAGFANGQGTNTKFSSPIGVALDSKGNLYVAELGNHRIRKITSDATVTTFAGSGGSAYADGTGTLAAFNIPTGIAVDLYDNLYVVDNGNHMIRRINPNGVVTTLAGVGTGGFSDGTGTSAVFKGPFGISIDAQGYLYVAEELNHRVRKLQ